MLHLKSIVGIGKTLQQQLQMMMELLQQVLHLLKFPHTKGLKFLL